MFKTEQSSAVHEVQCSAVRTDLLMDIDMKRLVDSRVVRMDLGPFASSGSESRSVKNHHRLSDCFSAEESRVR
jgi:hypothetical protein